MKGNLKLLDCTLRDGGFVNDWRFGNLTIRSLVSRLDNAGIDIIECGFLDSRAIYDKNRSMYPDIPSVALTLAETLPKRAMLVAMIDYGTFNEELLIPKEESVLDGVRLIFKKENVDEAMRYGEKIKSFGYKLFLNPVALTSYRDAELLQLIEKINAIRPYGMSIVDTYGLMFNNDIEKYIYLCDSNLDPEIGLGYHTHNNLQMGNAHCISFIEKNLRRPTVADVSILGMGKNAGNACTELICSYVQKTGLKNIDLNQIFECAYTDIEKFSSRQKWGYGLNTLLSALHDCSPNWISFLKDKNTLSVEGIRTILSSLPFEKREVSYFSKELAERKYLEYMDRHVDDRAAVNALANLLAGRNILLLCPGQTLMTHRRVIDTYIEENRPLIITVSFVTDMFGESCAFISNPNRYSQMLGIYPDLKEKPPVFITSNIVANDYLAPELVFNYKTLYEHVKGDNSTVLLIALLKKLNAGRITIAGMDGFDETHAENSFFDENMLFGSNVNINDVIIDQLRGVMDDGAVSLSWLTPSIIKDAAFKERS